MLCLQPGITTECLLFSLALILCPIVMQVHASDSVDPLLELLGSKYFKYTDVCYFTYTSVDKIANSLGSKTTDSGKDALQNGSNGSENNYTLFCMIHILNLKLWFDACKNNFSYSHTFKLTMRSYKTVFLCHI